MEIPSPGPSGPCSTRGLLESVASSRQLCTTGDAPGLAVYFGFGCCRRQTTQDDARTCQSRRRVYFQKPPIVSSTAMPLLQFCTGVSGSAMARLAPAHPETHRCLPIAVAVPITVPVTVAVPITSPCGILGAWAVRGARPGILEGQLRWNLGHSLGWLTRSVGSPLLTGCACLLPLSLVASPKPAWTWFGPMHRLDPLQRHGGAFGSSRLLTDPSTYRCGLTTG